MDQLDSVRLEKLKKIRELGYDAYPTFYRYTHTLSAVTEQFSEKSRQELEQSPETVRVTGRIIANR